MSQFHIPPPENGSLEGKSPVNESKPSSSPIGTLAQECMRKGTEQVSSSNNSIGNYTVAPHTGEDGGVSSVGKEVLGVGKPVADVKEDEDLSQVLDYKVISTDKIDGKKGNDIGLQIGTMLVDKENGDKHIMLKSEFDVLSAKEQTEVRARVTMIVGNDGKCHFRDEKAKEDLIKAIKEGKITHGDGISSDNFATFLKVDFADQNNFVMIGKDDWDQHIVDEHARTVSEGYSVQTGLDTNNIDKESTKLGVGEEHGKEAIDVETRYSMHLNNQIAQLCDEYSQSGELKQFKVLLAHVQEHRKEAAEKEKEAVREELKENIVKSEVQRRELTIRLLQAVENMENDVVEQVKEFFSQQINDAEEIVLDRVLMAIKMRSQSFGQGLNVENKFRQFILGEEAAKRRETEL